MRELSVVLVPGRLLPQADAVRELSVVLVPRRLLPQADAVSMLAGIAGEVQLRTVRIAIAASQPPTIGWQYPLISGCVCSTRTHLSDGFFLADARLFRALP